MKPKGNVVFVNFRGRRKPSFGGPRSGSGRTVGVFLALLGVEIFGAAVLLPSSIGSAFFGPTVIALAVAGTMGLSRMTAGLREARIRRRFLEPEGPAGGDSGRTGRTLH